MCEAQLHERCSFITLTYSEETLRARRPGWEPTVPSPLPQEEEPSPLSHRVNHARTEAHAHEDSLRKRDVQLFMKRLRDNLTTRGASTRVRFYAVGEYGERFQRPHYHIALFGEDFSGDRYYWRTSGENVCYRSPRLEKLWDLGNSEIGDLTIESAAYITSYVMKKVNGKKADEHYKRVCPRTGEIFWINPEFALMSRGGRRGRGLASEWFGKYENDVYPDDAVVQFGRKMKPPRYFDKLLDDYNPAKMAYVRMMREQRAKELAEDNTPARLADKEAVATAKMQLKKRNLEFK